MFAISKSLANTSLHLYLHLHHLLLLLRPRPRRPLLCLPIEKELRTCSKRCSRRKRQGCGEGIGAQTTRCYLACITAGL